MLSVTEEKPPRIPTNAGELPPHVYNRLIVPDLLVIAKEIKRQRPNALLCIFAKDAQLRRVFNFFRV